MAIIEATDTGKSEHYDADYFNWYKPLGQFAGWANASKFAKWLKPTDRVLDFGCGGGYLLSALECGGRYGVEVNPVAREQASKVLDHVYAGSGELPSDHFDVVISNSVLEHTLRPFDEVCNIYRTLKPGGKLVIVVPCESINWKYKPKDVNNHLFGWSPMGLGNLLTEAGFSVVESRAYWSQWPPGYRAIAKLGRPVFRAACYVWGHIYQLWFQVRAVATKPV